MKKSLFILLTVAAVWISDADLFAADTNSIEVDLNGIITRVIEKLQQGKSTEPDLASNLAEYDALYARHKGEKSEAAAQILLAKANLYTQVLKDPEKAVAVLKQFQHDFPEVQINGNTDKLIEDLQRAAEVKKIQSSLVEGAPFPGFDEKDINGKPLSIANYKGKVVLVDFWATWCPLCLVELPNVMATYNKYHDQGFEVIGISLDEDRQQLERFLKTKAMTWPQYNDGLYWKTKLAVKYGIEQLPSNYLLDGKGTIIGRNLMGDALGAAVAKALASK
ncbi:MAG: TlpA family protein disulfide reductase [Limisphaerales bacterium]